ncbi:MAG TPA: multicopper oxidase domain-containing protein, partial [Longimicrobiaceae bacterium]|nr:multicopper oxidase domain-containing protein [Longimicrobiaceae bacterium]
APGQYASGEMRDEALLSGHHGGDPERHVEQGMGGLMLGITVTPPEGWRPNEAKRRENRLFVVSDSLAGERRRFGYVLAGADGEPPVGSVRWPGSTIVAWKGEATSVTVINRSPEPTQIHWHGLEIDSYYDGVVGFGGHPGSLTPAIMPADSFEMRITPPRAGSFMYHTHVNDIRQQSAGLYGGFVVLEEGQAWDPEHDYVVLLSTNNDPDMSLLLNGTREPDPLVLTAGDTYRFRIMNITLFNGGRVRLVRDGYPVRWRALAKDGADLPPHQRTVDFADRIVNVGETADFEWSAPEEAAELVLELRSREGDLFVAQPVRVEAPGAGADAR